MINRWEWLISNATLDVLDFDIHARADDFNDTNRLYSYYVMSYVKEGHAEAVFGGKTHSHGPGQLLIIPPNVRHDHRVPPGGARTTFLWWHFTLTIGGVVDIIRLINYPSVIGVCNSLAFESAFVQYVALYAEKPTVPNMVLKRAKGLEVMAYLLENMLQSIDQREMTLPGVPDAFFEIFMRLVEHPEENLSLGALSERYYMNPTYISNRFKKLFGMTPMRLQHELLIGRAKAMIAQGGTPITDIARTLGFPDVSSFTRFFSTREGVAPSQYKELL